jgi:hypothetical protein
VTGLTARGGRPKTEPNSVSTNLFVLHGGSFLFRDAGSERRTLLAPGDRPTRSLRGRRAIGSSYSAIPPRVLDEPIGAL